MKLRKKIQQLSTSLSGVEDMRGRPDVVFVSDIVRDKYMLRSFDYLHCTS